MEGPTPSSAIFYGALSIHAGVFLLIRTYELWSHRPGVKILVGGIGLITFILSTLQGRVQANIKGQIAYASVAQIGIMFIELSFGLLDLVMIHLVAHGVHRCFQMLLSPSIVFNSLGRNYSILINRFNNHKSIFDRLPNKIRKTLYLLALSDFEMDLSWRGFRFLSWRRAFGFFQDFLQRPLYLLTVSLVLMTFLWISQLPMAHFVIFFSLLLSLRSLFYHHNPFYSCQEMTLGLISSWAGLYLLSKDFSMGLFISMISLVPALVVMNLISYHFRNLDLRNFYAQGLHHRFLANSFFVSFLIVAGMPVSSAFLGEDILLEELINHSHTLTVLVALILMNCGLVGVKLYTRIFMGTPQSAALDE
jgi:NADH-quinone oxidoreductase subunit L